jgi:hypothetical protein
MTCTWQRQTRATCWTSDFTYSDGTRPSAASGRLTRAWANGPLHAARRRRCGRARRSGEAAGNALQLALHAAPAGGRHGIEVHFDDWMYLMDDRVMLEPRRA